ncbi:iron-containing alcohol dehydrogenase [Sodalis sp. RH22]|uniref:iron-containing alcohol dehydrogenase n=1 Tax=unclassified Sodalis (in: enterobacteria) TaxID=2636512 RepID=UPI0039B661EA
MKSFKYVNGTEIVFGSGALHQVGEITRRYGQRALLVTTPVVAYMQPLIDKITARLTDSGVNVAFFDGVVPNPTTESITAGARRAREFKADVVIGFGGGSSMDTAKAIAVEATHPGTAWDYLFFKQPPSATTLPIIAITTTSGTGSHVTQVAVLSENDTKTKSAIYNDIILPKVAIVDPSLMLTLPKSVTAMTGFDAFTHAFESMIHPATSPFIEMMAKEVIHIVINTLPLVLRNHQDLELREKMAWADTLAGLCIKSAGVTLPHGQGMAISGLFSHVAHGEALAIVYPAFIRFTWQSAIPAFAVLARELDPTLTKCPDNEAAEHSAQLMKAFLSEIGLNKTLRDVGMTEKEIPELAVASMLLPDYKGNPRIATSEEMIALIKEAYYGA